MNKLTPDRIIGMAGGFQAAKVLMTANELGIFKALSGGPKASDELAGALKLDPEAAGLLMGALVGLGLVSHRGGKFKNAPDVRKFLGAEGEGGISCITNHLNHMYGSWQGLDEIVKKGRPKRREIGILTDKKKNREFIRGMFEIGYPTARMLAEELDLSGVKKLADIGGGPAQYPIAFAEKAPEAVFVVADYPNTLTVAREFVRKYGLEKRIKLKRCEFFDTEDLGIGGDYDMALLSQVLHAAGEKSCAALIEKTYRILRPGGRIVINENALNNDKMGPPMAQVFAINMLVNNDGRTYSPAEMSVWLKAAGFKGIKSRRLHERSVIIEATRPR